jgi:hypothetical protein
MYYITSKKCMKYIVVIFIKELRIGLMMAN